MQTDHENYFGPSIEVVQKAIRAIYLGDLKALEAVALPDPELSLVLSKQFVPKYDIAKLDDEIAHMQINPAGQSEPRVGDTTLWLTAYFRGMITPVTLVRVGDDWKVECRWWIAARKPDDEARRAAREFVLAMMTADIETLVRVTLPDEEIGQLVKHGGPPSGEYAQLHHVAEATMIAPARVGESFIDTTREPSVVSASEFADDRSLMLALIGAQPPAMPVRLVKSNGKWLVNARPFIEMMKNE
jgi:hypothetical protein